LLEELLADFQGTLFLVSHDRDFLNRVVTSTLAFEGKGLVTDYVGGYDDWLRQRPQPKPETGAPTPRLEKPKPERERPRKLSFRERHELDELPRQIETLEAELAALHERMADPAFYREQGEEVAAATARLQQLEGKLETAYARWEGLAALEG
jgi:ATP-binding cassette subfamily F protein uup